MAPDVLFSAEQIQERVRAMARLIAGAPLVPDVAMPVLVGGFVFAADLLRALSWEGVAMDVEMIWLRSYGDKRVASAISPSSVTRLTPQLPVPCADQPLRYRCRSRRMLSASSRALRPRHACRLSRHALRPDPA